MRAERSVLEAHRRTDVRGLGCRRLARDVFKDGDQVTPRRGEIDQPPHSETLIGELVCLDGDVRLNIIIRQLAAFFNRGVQQAGNRV